MFKLFVFILISSVSYINCASLETLNDDSFVDLIRDNKNLIVLFAKKDCGDKCDYEQSLVTLKDELTETLSAKVFKLENSQLVRLYNPQKKEPAIVFLRKGVPLLYDEADNHHDIFDFFNHNRDPIVKELDDSNFEHLTQASSGSTTGDWLVQFYSSDCVECQRLQAIWESVAAKLRARLNVARVNIGRNGMLTGKRFKIEKKPEFILLRQGKYYRYNINKWDIESFVSFAQTWYKNITPEKVQAPATPFENLVDSIVKQLKAMPNLIELSKKMTNDTPLILIAIVSSIFLMFAIILYSCLKKDKTPSPAKSNIKKKEK
ncbi:unnamed protein product [Diamesa hyperborea]